MCGLATISTFPLSIGCSSMTGAALGRGDGGVDRRVYNRPSGIASVFPQFLVAEVCFNEFSIGLCGFRLRTKTVIGHLITINPDVNPS